MMTGFSFNIRNIRDSVYGWLKDKIIKCRKVLLSEKTRYKKLKSQLTRELDSEATFLLGLIFSCFAFFVSCAFMLFFSLNSSFCFCYLMGNGLFFWMQRCFWSSGLLSEGVFRGREDDLGERSFELSAELGLFLFLLLCLVASYSSVMFASALLAANRSTLVWPALLAYPLLHCMVFLVFNVEPILGSLGFHSDYFKLFERFSPASLCCILPTLTFVLYQSYIDPIFLSFTVFVSAMNLTTGLITSVKLTEETFPKDMEGSRYSASIHAQSLEPRDLESGSSLTQGRCCSDGEQASEQVQAQTSYLTVSGSCHG